MGRLASRQFQRGIGVLGPTRDKKQNSNIVYHYLSFYQFVYSLVLQDYDGSKTQLFFSLYLNNTNLYDLGFLVTLNNTSITLITTNNVVCFQGKSNRRPLI